MSSLYFDDKELVCLTPEGVEQRMPVKEVGVALSPARYDTCDSILVDGVKALVPGPRGLMVAVHQTPPQVFGFQWITDESPEPCGYGAKYGEISVALPYVIILAIFRSSPHGLTHLRYDECFFSVNPLKSMDDPLLYSCLLNNSRFKNRSPNNPVAWICTQHLNPPMDFAHPERNLGLQLTALRHHLFETGFNRSSEVNEGDSWFRYTMSKKIDPRLKDVRTWEKESKKDPLMALSVPWIPSGNTVREHVERMLTVHGGSAKPSNLTVTKIKNVVHKYAAAQEVGRRRKAGKEKNAEALEEA